MWVGNLSLLQGIFPSQESKQGFLLCTWILYQLGYQRSPNYCLSFIFMSPSFSGFITLKFSANYPSHFQMPVEIIFCFENINIRRNIYIYFLHFTVSYTKYSAISSVQLLSHVQLFVTQWIAALQASLSITNFRSLLKFISIESVMPSSHLILRRPLLILLPISPSIRVFSNESTLCLR